MAIKILFVMYSAECVLKNQLFNKFRRISFRNKFLKNIFTSKEKLMHKFIFFIGLILVHLSLCFGQEKPLLNNDVFQPSNKRIIDIVHTQLEVTPDFKNLSLYGKAFLILKPFNKNLQTITLDAKGMTIQKVAILEENVLQPLDYTYDNLQIQIALLNEIGVEDSITIFVEYSAHPYNLETKGISLAAGRGLFIIDPMDKNPYKGKQLWTSSGSAANSIWFPTVDAPNESFSQEIAITVDTQLVTLSNGILEKTTLHSNGTKTDYWSQKLPHAPYLVMIAAGEFAIVKDTWRNLEVPYYTLPELANDVDAIFGRTPEMLTFFSEKFGVDFPWDKYAQIVVYDFIAGAMENTSASVFYETYYADKYDLIDRNFDDIIAHEIVHQWFGDLVTCESWAHLSLNEAFATYGEVLWFENQFGKNEGDKVNHDFLLTYLDEYQHKKDPIIKYYFENPDEDLFDAHRYEKGARVLHQLQDYLGVETFYAGLNHYLNKHKHQPVEIHDLRLALEEFTGEDLFWFFDQWFLQAGHPIVQIVEQYDAKNNQVHVYVQQTQGTESGRAFMFPLSIDVYTNGKVTRHEVWVKNLMEKFNFKVEKAPDLVNVDAKKVMLWEKKEFKTVEALQFQYANAPLFLDKLEALEGLELQQTKANAREVFLAALEDEFWAIREFAAKKIDLKLHEKEGLAIQILQQMALSDSSSAVRRAALEKLAAYQIDLAITICETLIEKDSSRKVIGIAIGILDESKHPEIFSLASPFESVKNVYLYRSISKIYANLGDSTKNDYLKKAIWTSRDVHVPLLLDFYETYLKRMDANVVENGVHFLKDLALYEESGNTQTIAKQLLIKLKDYFSTSKAHDNKIKLAATKAALAALD
jgi:aminopeptidase N